MAGSFARLHLKPAAARRTLTPRMAVDVDVKDLPGSQKKLTIKVSGDECTNAYESVLAKLVRGAEIPGFRKGKAPPQMVLNHFGKKSISAEACESIIGAAVPLALQQKDIRAIGQVSASVCVCVSASVWYVQRLQVPTPLCAHLVEWCRRAWRTRQPSPTCLTPSSPARAWSLRCSLMSGPRLS